jgi:hypothetical protein
VAGDALPQRRLFLGQAPFNELTLEIGQERLEEPAIPADVVAVRAQAGQMFADHLRHPLTGVAVLSEFEGQGPEAVASSSTSTFPMDRH